MSANCNESHRMFEIAIPITELEGYTSTGDLGIYLQGYGTLAFPVLHSPYSNSYQVRPSFYFGVGTQTAYFLFFVIWNPSSPDWSQNYYKLAMGQNRTILI